MRFILKFSDALTLTHNATSLILPTGANITTADGDIACMESLGSGNWSCLFYTRANGAPLDAELAAIAGLTSAANVVPRFTGSGTAEVYTLTSGTYTPTVTNKSNIASVGTVTDAHYFRIGNEVTVRGRFIATPTATGATEVYVTLPVASNLAAATDLVGTGYVDDYLTTAIIGDPTGDQAIIVANVASTSALNFLYDFTYTVV